MKGCLPEGSLLCRAVESRGWVNDCLYGSIGTVGPMRCTR